MEIREPHVIVLISNRVKKPVHVYTFEITNEQIKSVYVWQEQVPRMA